MEWQKKINKQISFSKSLIIILVLFLFSTIIIYLTAVDNPALAYQNNYNTKNLTKSNQLVILATPVVNQVLGDRFLLSGETTVKQEQLKYRLVTKAGEIIQQGAVLINLSTSKPFFSDEIAISNSASGRGFLVIFYIKPSNGTSQDLLSLPIIFSN